MSESDDQTSTLSDAHADWVTSFTGIDVRAGVSAVTDTVSAVAGAVSTAAGDAVTTATGDAVSSVSDTVSNVTSTVAATARDVVSDATATIASGVSTAANDISTAVTDTGAQVVSTVSSAAGSVADTAHALGDGAAAMADAAGNAISDVAGTLTTGLADVSDGGSATLTDLSASAFGGSGGGAPGGGAPSGDAPEPLGDVADFDKLVGRAGKIKSMAEQFYKIGAAVESKGKHIFSSDDTSLLAAAKSINDTAKALTTLGSEIDSYGKSPNKDAIKTAADAEKYIGIIINAADFIVKARDTQLAVDKLDAATSEEAVNAWADSVGEIFASAGGLLDAIPSGVLPGFVTDYYKGLFTAPKNYIAAFKKIMKEHYSMVDDEGHVTPGKGKFATDFGGTVEWEGELSGVYVAAGISVKNAAGQTLANFMDTYKSRFNVSKHKYTAIIAGVDMITAGAQAGKSVLSSAVMENLRDKDPARQAWLDLINR